GIAQEKGMMHLRALTHVLPSPANPTEHWMELRKPTFFRPAVPAPPRPTPAAPSAARTAPPAAAPSLPSSAAAHAPAPSRPAPQGDLVAATAPAAKPRQGGLALGGLKDSSDSEDAQKVSETPRFDEVSGKVAHVIYQTADGFAVYAVKDRKGNDFRVSVSSSIKAGKGDNIVAKGSWGSYKGQPTFRAVMIMHEI